MDLSPNQQAFATEVFKVCKTSLPEIAANPFHAQQNNSNFSHNSYFAITNVKSVYHVRTVCKM